MRVGWYQWGVRGAVKKELDSNDSALGGGEGRGRWGRGGSYSDAPVAVKRAEASV